MNLIIAFKHKLHDNERNDHIISLWTGSPYMHAQLIFPDGRCFSAWTKRGVEYRTIEETVEHPKLYRFFELNVAYDLAGMEQFERQQRGKGFDYRGLYWCRGIAFNIEDKSKWFCSEVTYYTLQKYTSLQLPVAPPCQIDPGTLLKLIEAQPKHIVQEVFYSK